MRSDRGRKKAKLQIGLTLKTDFRKMLKYVKDFSVLSFPCVPYPVYGGLDAECLMKDFPLSLTNH